jgi:hypothetical protein
MLRIFLEIVLPLLLPTALYLIWVYALGPARGGGAIGLPWPWLIGTGVLLLAGVLVVAALVSGGGRQGVYVPPRWQNGHIVPGHFEPASR